MDAQSSINFVGSVLPIVTALVPGLAQIEGAVTVVEDGIKVEQAVATWLSSSAGADTQKKLQKLFADFGVKTVWGADGYIGVTPVDALLEQRDDPDPWN